MMIARLLAVSALFLLPHCAGDAGDAGDAGGAGGAQKAAVETPKEADAGPAVTIRQTRNGGRHPRRNGVLEFVAKRYQKVLVISTRNELLMIHHSYALDSLVLSVPVGIKVVPVARQLNGSGEPDLGPPV